MQVCTWIERSDSRPSVNLRNKAEEVGDDSSVTNKKY